MPSRSPSPAVELKVFGVPATFVRGREARLPLKRAVALLAYLAFNRGPVPRGHLAAMLWPDADEAQGRTRLRRLIYTIEHAVGRRILASDSDCLALMAQSLEVDALRFTEFARRAVALVASGRPSCPFCGRPIDAEGHICPRANGYRRHLPE